MSKNDDLYLAHIAECAEYILNAAKKGKDIIINDKTNYDACLRNLQTMSESCNRLSDQLKNKYANINWKQIHGFRNVLVHDYLGELIPGKIWETINNRLPGLLEMAQKELKAKK